MDEERYEAGARFHALFLEKVEQHMGKGSAGMMTPWNELGVATKRVWHESAQAFLSSCAE